MKHRFDNKYTRVNIDKLKEEKRKEKSNYLSKLNTSLSIPSLTNTYSLSIGYIKQWFFNRFPESYLKYWTVDERNYNKAFDAAKARANLKIQRPSLLITPRMDFDYNRDGLDHNLYGTDLYIRTHGRDKAFLKDNINNIFLALDMEQIRVGYTFRFRVNTRAQQLDLFKILKMKCKLGSTFYNEADVDFHLPYDLMVQLAKDVGFKIKYIEDKNTKNELIENIPGFLSYLNSHSQYPIMSKLRPITGKHDFFLRVSHIPINIDVREGLSPDDGEMIDQLKTNFVIEMRVVMDMASPRYYAYYSMNPEHKISSNDIYKYVMPLEVIQLPNIPLVNQKGWEQYSCIDIEEENLDKPMEICFEELLYGSEETALINTVRKLINLYNKEYLSPTLFMDIKIFNHGKEVDFEIDWRKFTIKTLAPLRDIVSRFVIYLNMEYINEYKINVENMTDNSINNINEFPN